MLSKFNAYRRVNSTTDDPTISNFTQDAVVGHVHEIVQGIERARAMGNHDWTELQVRGMFLCLTPSCFEPRIRFDLLFLGLVSEMATVLTRPGLRPNAARALSVTDR